MENTQKIYTYKNYSLEIENDMSDPSEIGYYQSLYKDDLLEYEKSTYYNSNLTIEVIYMDSGEFLSYTHNGSTDTFYLTSSIAYLQNLANSKIDDLIRNNHPIFARLLSKISSQTWKPLISENNIVSDNNELLNKYAILKAQNTSLTRTIPYLIAKSSIQESLDIINKYIVTKKLDTTRLSCIIDSLNSLSGLASRSLQLLQDFSNSPTSCDLRNLSENLNKSLKNIDAIIELKNETIERN